MDEKMSSIAFAFAAKGEEELGDPNNESANAWELEVAAGRDLGAISKIEEAALLGGLEGPRPEEAGNENELSPNRSMSERLSFFLAEESSDAKISAP